MGNTPDSSVSERPPRTRLPRQFSDSVTIPLPVLTEDDPRHGSVNGYTNFRCRCDDCKGAWSAYRAARRIKRAEAAR
jgi:hypothetical protein